MGEASHSRASLSALLLARMFQLPLYVMTAKDGETEVSKKRRIRLETMMVGRLPMWTPGLADVYPCTMPEASKSQNLELGLREGWAYLADSRCGLKQ